MSRALAPDEATKILTLRVCESMEISLTEAARRQAMTRSEMIRQVLAELIEREHEEAA